MAVEAKVEMTRTLHGLLNPGLNCRVPIFSEPLRPPARGEKVFSLSETEIRNIRALRGAVVDLHPGMGGIAPDAIIKMVVEGAKITSLDFMLTNGCNFECTWCYAGSGPLMKDYLPFEILERLTEEGLEVGARLFILTGGEPLMYRDPALGKQAIRGDHFFKVVAMIREKALRKGIAPKILTFDDVALITPEIARRFAKHEIGLCTKGDTLIAELQDYKVNQAGAFKRMQAGYHNLMDAGYGTNPALRLVVNSVLDHTTFDGMLDLHVWVMENGFDHSIVPVHYCSNAEDEDQETGIHSPHVKVLYDLIARIDRKYFNMDWTPWSAFAYNKTCNRNRSGLHIRANGDVTACSESPDRTETDRYTFGNVFDDGFSLAALARGEKLARYRTAFAAGHGVYVCSPDVCDLYANDLCMGGCATRSAYSRIDYDTGLIVKNDNHHNYSDNREDPLCPAWTVLAEHQNVLREGLLESIHDRLVGKSTRINASEFPYRRH